MLALYGHPISSFTWKALTALYENDTPFELITVDQSTYADFKALWPIAKFPVLHDKARGKLVPEASLVIEYLDTHYPGPTRFLPDRVDDALVVRHWDRFCDLYINTPLGKIIVDLIRPENQRDPVGVDDARALLCRAYDVLETQVGEFLVGGEFSMADCAAAPALWYATRNVPLTNHTRVGAYLERMTQRPSFARAVEESKPLFHMYPGA